MDKLGLTGFILMYVIVGLAGVFILLSMFLNSKRAEKFHQQLTEKLKSVRLNRMLSAVGIDVAKYLHTEQVVDIHKHMTACSDCKNIEKCDEQLASGKVDPRAIAYCENEKELQEMLLKEALNKSD